MSSIEAARNGCMLTIAGSDSGAGAGIQADLKTFAAHGLYGVTVLTMVTAQSTSSVDAVHILDPGIITGQLQTVFADFEIRAIKTGALGNSDVINAVADFFNTSPHENLVIDPVMISKHGHRLIDEKAVATLKQRLLPLAACVTPNLPEALALTGLQLDESEATWLDAGRALLDCGARSAVIKGGHLAGSPRDLLVTADGSEWFESARIDSPHTHGTGCTFSSAIAANLALGYGISDAVRLAKEYVTGAILHAGVFGRGINPVNHFWRDQPDYGKLR